MDSRAYFAGHAWLPQGFARDVRIEVDEGRFLPGALLAVEAGGAPQGAEALGRFVVPGMPNLHSHAFQRAMRGDAQRPGPDDFWSWRAAMYRVATALTPESIFEISRVAFRELHAAGVRTVGEFHYIQHQPDGSPYDDRTVMSDAVVRAAKDAGLWVHLGSLALLSARAARQGAALLALLARRIGLRVRPARRLATATTVLLLAALSYRGLSDFVPAELGRYRGWYGIDGSRVQQLQVLGLQDALVFVQQASWVDYAPFFAQSSPSLDGSVAGRSNTALAAVTAPLPEISSTIAAATKNDRESITNAGPIPTTTMNAPARGGPTIEDSWSVPCSSELADGRRSASTVRGRNDCWAGR